MRRFWFGVGILVLLLAAGLCLGDTLEELFQPAHQDLDKAAVAAVEEDWPLASALYLRAEKHWDKNRDLVAALIRHDPIEQIEAGFASLPGYAACEDTAGFCSACGQLAQQLRSLPQPHGTKWWNIL